MPITSVVSDKERRDNRKKIITTFFHNPSSSIPELAKQLDISIPTVTKLVNELVERGVLIEYGKSDSKTGRKPNTYGLNPQSGYFLGIDIKRNHLNMALCNFNGEIVNQEFTVPFAEEKSPSEKLDDICDLIKAFIAATGIEKSKILNACVNMSGRVNPATGFCHSSFNLSELPLSELLSEKIGISVCIENDTRAMTYGEMLRGVAVGEKNILYVNMGWGLGLGMIINGQIYEGKSGFSGEFGHINAFDNEILCHCGKKGCLETEVSGRALYEEIIARIKEGKVSVLSQKVKNNELISMRDIVDAINDEDFLCIDLLEEIGKKLGRQLANLITLFNPGLVVIGGVLSDTGDYLIHPVRQAVKKHSLKLVNNDTNIVCSKLHEKGGVIGACMTARRNMFERAKP